MKITIHITKEVLSKTSKCRYIDVENCAIAYAVREIFPKAAVTGLGIYVNYYSSRDMPDIRMPEVGREFIARFDSLWLTPAERLSLPELSFDIDVPDEVINMIGIEEATRIIKDSKTLSLVAHEV